MGLKDISVLVDCGEGTLDQLHSLSARLCAGNIEHALEKIRVILITHHHTDHYLGLFKILEERDRVVARRQTANKEGKET